MHYLNINQPAQKCKQQNAQNPASAEEQFREAAARRGLNLENIAADGKLHRCPVAGNRGAKRDGAYVLHLDGIPAGGFENWCDGEGWENWRAETGGRQWTPAEKAEYKAKIERQRAEREKDEAAVHADARKRAALFLNGKSRPATADHPYLVKKRIKPHGARACGSLLLVDGRDVNGELRALQFIAPDGTKTFLKGSRKRGSFHVIGAIDPDGRNLICEGFATGASCHEATGLPVLVAFDAGNLLLAAEAFMGTYEGAGLIVAADDDWKAMDAQGRPINPGIIHATEAARTLGIKMAVPIFSGERQKKWTDFNDLAIAEGLDAVRRRIEAAALPWRAPRLRAISGGKDATANLNGAHASGTDASEDAAAGGRAGEAKPNGRGGEGEPHAAGAEADGNEKVKPNGSGGPCSGNSGNDTWGEPEPLIEVMQHEPYPVAVLPDGIREAVAEVAAYMRCPPEVPAASALSVLSIAGQGIANVYRDKRLNGPASIFSLAILDSGDRKTSIDKLFSEPLFEYQKKRQEAMEPSLKTFHAATAAWKAKRLGINKGIEAAARKGQDCTDLEKKLRDLEAMQPFPPRIPNFIYENTTLEAMTWEMHSRWPSAGLLSPEAGIVLGGYSMRADGLMANLAALNALWDGKPHPINRRHSESYLLNGARLTVGIAAQSEVLHQFLERTKGLARGSGFLARFLLLCPESTAGWRPYIEEPEWKYLDSFNATIAALLRDAPQPDAKDGKIAFASLRLSPAAKALWIAFYDKCEASMRPDRDFTHLKDIASKAPENAARLAALFHLYRHGQSGEIGAEDMERAATIVEWHLLEMRRFLFTATIPREQRNAIELDAWLIKYCTREKKLQLPSREILRLGPYAIRKGKAKARDEALAELEALSRVRLATEGMEKTVLINPKLSGE